MAADGPIRADDDSITMDDLVSLEDAGDHDPHSLDARESSQMAAAGNEDEEVCTKTTTLDEDSSEEYASEGDRLTEPKAADDIQSSTIQKLEGAQGCEKEVCIAKLDRPNTTDAN